MGLRNHLEKKIEARLRAAYNDHARSFAAILDEGRRAARVPESAEDFLDTIARVHTMAWEGALSQVDPRRELGRSVGREKLNGWLNAIAGDFFGAMLQLPPREALSVLQEAIRRTLAAQAGAAL